MLVSEVLPHYRIGAYIMTDTALIVANAASTLTEIAKQAETLGSGLLNAAPGEKGGKPNASVLYLLETSELLKKLADECSKLDK